MQGAARALQSGVSIACTGNHRAFYTPAGIARLKNSVTVFQVI